MLNPVFQPGSRYFLIIFLFKKNNVKVNESVSHSLYMKTVISGILVFLRSSLSIGNHVYNLLIKWDCTLCAQHFTLEVFLVPVVF